MTQTKIFTSKLIANIICLFHFKHVLKLNEFLLNSSKGWLYAISEEVLVISGTASMVLQLSLAKADDERVFSALGELGRRGCSLA